MTYAGCLGQKKREKDKQMKKRKSTALRIKFAICRVLLLYDATHDTLSPIKTLSSTVVRVPSQKTLTILTSS